ncbi:MAG: succinylglutamate desuccinylase/aspartoacylase family protein [Syntrophales bacterium]
MKHIQSVFLLVVAAAMVAWSGVDFRTLYEREVVVKGPGVTAVRQLSDYFPALKGTVADTDVFILEGNKPGGTVFVMGGVHANESAGMLSAVMLVENAVVTAGRLIVVPHANESGFTNTAPSEGVPPRFHIKTPWGSRWFRYGDRLTNPVHQWPDPEVYVHYPSGQYLSDFDVRNLDRAFPGRANGNFTERLGYALTELVRREKVTLTVDLHEARPMNPIVNCIITHDRARELSSLTVIDLESKGIQMRLEPSPKKLRGMSHRELGDHTETLSVLMETGNPIQDKLHARADEALILTGKDEFFARAAARGLIYVPYLEKGLALEERVGRNMSALRELIAVLSDLNPGQKVTVERIPDYQSVREKGMGHFLRKP